MSARRRVSAALLAAIAVGGLAATSTPANAAPAPISSYKCNAPDYYQPDVIGYCDSVGIAPRKQWRIRATCSDGSYKYSPYTNWGYTNYASCAPSPRRVTGATYQFRNI